MEYTPLELKPDFFKAAQSKMNFANIRNMSIVQRFLQKSFLVLHKINVFHS